MFTMSYHFNVKYELANTIICPTLKGSILASVKHPIYFKNDCELDRQIIRLKEEPVAISA